MTQTDAIFARAVIAHRQGNLDEAAKLCQQGLSINATHADTLHLLAVVALQRGQASEAERLTRQAIGVEINERFCNTLGEALRAQRRIDEAIEQYRRSLSIRADYVSAMNNLSLVLIERHELEEAISLTRRVVQFDPRNLKAYNRLGAALVARQQFTEAAEALQTAIRIDPSYAKPYVNLGNAFSGVGDAENAVKCHRAALEREPTNAEARSNLLFALNYLPDLDRATIFAEHRKFDEVHAKPLMPTNAKRANDPDPDRVLRIGYVSPDFSDHAVSFFLEPILASRDWELFEIYCYASVARPDAVTNRMRDLCGQQRWRNVAQLNDHELAEMIRSDRIDVLIDLAEHTTGNRLLTFAEKPAPVQATYLGYPQTTGLSAIDYKISHATIDPPTVSQAFHSERLVYLPETYFCYGPRAGTPDVGPGPADSAPITFVSVNGMLKVNHRVLSTWAKLLERVSGARLIIKGAGLQTDAGMKRMQELCKKCGLPMERVELQPPESFDDFMRFFDRAHISLDPFPYNGGTTTCHTLYMGVPVVTLMGETPVSRMGASVLHAMGLRQLIATTPEEYIDIAARLAEDPVQIKALRNTLRQRMTESPLTDAVRFTRNLESLYRTMWQSWCESQC